MPNFVPVRRANSRSAYALNVMIYALVLWVGAAASVARAEAPNRTEDLSSLPLDALLDMQVSGASKFTQRASESAASVTVIGAAEIRALGYRTLADVLQSVRGLNVSNDRNYSYLGVRGVATPGDYNTRVLLLVDGNRINDPIYGQAYIGSEFPVDVAMIERVEFIPGQGSSLYGSNALFGVINVITRQPVRELGELGLAFGSGRAREARGGFTHLTPDGDRLQLAVSRLLSAGKDVLIPTLVDLPDVDGHARGADYERRSNVYLRVESGPLAFTLNHSDRLKGAPATLDLALGDPRNFNRDAHTMFDLTLKQPLDSSSEFTARAFMGRYRFDGQYVYDDESPVNADVAVGRWWGVEARLFSTRWASHKTVAGVELQRDTQLLQTNRDLGAEGATYLDDDRQGYRAALYVEDQFELLPRWTLTAGARYDHDGSGLRRISPRVALNYRPTDDLVLKLIHGSAYRRPNAFEAFYAVDTPAGYQLNPALREETVRGDELALEWQPEASSRVAVSAYSNTGKQLLALGYDAQIDRYMFSNTSVVRSTGLELEFNHIWQNGARLRTSLSLQRTRDSGDVELAAYFPRRIAKLSAVLPLFDDWTLGGEVQGVSKRADAAGFAKANATLTRHLGHGGSAVSVSAYNLFDRGYNDPGVDPIRQPTITQDRRSLWLRLDLAL